MAARRNLPVRLTQAAVIFLCPFLDSMETRRYGRMLRRKAGRQTRSLADVQQ